MFEAGDYVRLLPHYSDDNVYKITSIFSAGSNEKLNTIKGKPDITIENVLTKNSMFCNEDCLMFDQKYYRKKKINKICSNLGTR